MSARLQLIDKGYSRLSLAKQCQLLGLNRSNCYYRPAPVSEGDLFLMNKIDEIYTEQPYYGSPKITKELKRLGLTVKYEEVCLKDYRNFDEAQGSLSQYFNLYNSKRLHASLSCRTPQEVYFSKVENVSHNH